MKHPALLSCVGLGLIAAVSSYLSARSPQDPPSAPSAVRNPQVDFPAYLVLAQSVGPIRAQRLLTEAQFAKSIGEPDTVLLDARSADKFAMRHIKGAISLPFTDFTAESLRKVIPEKGTRVLIYCNNNFAGDPIALATKIAPASLNISTFIALTTYGYTNVFELGPFLNVNTTQLPFEGTAIGR